MRHDFPRRVLFGLATPWLVALAQRCAHTARADEVGDSAAARLREMTQLAQRIKIDGAALRPRPIVRYDDPLREIEDATLWAFVARGRPVATLKVEIYRPGHALYGLVSLSSDVIRAQCSDGWEWAATRPGMVLEAIPRAPTPGDTAVERLVQMRSLARRFSGYELEPSARGRLQMRLMTSPIDRYTDSESGVQDGALFSLANGTNPEVLFAIESRNGPGGTAAWHYGIARMGGATLVVLLDGKQVWRAEPALPVPAVRPTYMNRLFPRGGSSA